jgi:hypothetical protein
MAANGLDYDMVSADEKLALKDKLLGLCNVNNEGAFGAAMYYKCVIAKTSRHPRLRRYLLSSSSFSTALCAGFRSSTRCR